jgi:hypothetical protein
MSAQAAGAVLSRSYDDEAFVQEFVSDPATALSQYDLTPSERAAFINREEDAMLAAAGKTREANYVIVAFETP